jgi:hypothetical protein
MAKPKRDLRDILFISDLGGDDLARANARYSFDRDSGCVVFNSEKKAEVQFGCGFELNTARTPYITLTPRPFDAFADSFVRGIETTWRLPAVVGVHRRAQTGRGYFDVQFIWDSRNDDRLRKALLESVPWKWPGSKGEALFGCRLWALSGAEQCYSDEELRLVFLDAIDLQRRKFERLKSRLDRRAQSPLRTRREIVPEEVRIYVWRRDNGRCVQCGNDENLEYDHIIPVSKGGSNTERNIQLLCELCNRRKSDSI